MAPVAVPAGTVVDGDAEKTAANLAVLLDTANRRLFQSGAWYDRVMVDYAAAGRAVAKAREGTGR